MAYLTFPASVYEWMNAKEYGEEIENPAMDTQMEAGYTYTRPKFTRRPRKTFDVSLNHAKQSVKDDLVSFWNTVKGSSDAFYWDNPTAPSGPGKTLLVRFARGPLKLDYKGAGPTFLWDIKFQLEEV